MKRTACKWGCVQLGSFSLSAFVSGLCQYALQECMNEEVRSFHVCEAVAAAIRKRGKNFRSGFSKAGSSRKRRWRHARFSDKVQGLFGLVMHWQRPVRMRRQRHIDLFPCKISVSPGLTRGFARSTSWRKMKLLSSNQRPSQWSEGLKGQGEVVRDGPCTSRPRGCRLLFRVFRPRLVVPDWREVSDTPRQFCRGMF